DIADPGLAQVIHQTHLVRHADRLLFVLQTVAGADFVEANPAGQGTGEAGHDRLRTMQETTLVRTKTTYYSVISEELFTCFCTCAAATWRWAISIICSRIQRLAGSWSVLSCQYRWVSSGGTPFTGSSTECIWWRWAKRSGTVITMSVFSSTSDAAR